jgi:hypothetical protein
MQTTFMLSGGRYVRLDAKEDTDRRNDVAYQTATVSHNKARRERALRLQVAKNCFEVPCVQRRQRQSGRGGVKLRTIHRVCCSPGGGLF